MTKKEIKTVLKEKEWTMIDKSYYCTDNEHLFTAYNHHGMVAEFFVNCNMLYARRQYLSSVLICESHNIDHWFF